MDIIHVTVAVALIMDEMFPKTALAIDLTPLAAAFRNALPFFDGTKKASPDQAPADRAVLITGTSVQLQCKP